MSNQAVVVYGAPPITLTVIGDPTSTVAVARQDVLRVVSTGSIGPSGGPNIVALAFADWPPLAPQEGILYLRLAAP